jgi:hypothetical protein
MIKNARRNRKYGLPVPGQVVDTWELADEVSKSTTGVERTHSFWGSLLGRRLRSVTSLETWLGVSMEVAEVHC